MRFLCVPLVRRRQWQIHFRWTLNTKWLPQFVWIANIFAGQSRSVWIVLNASGWSDFNCTEMPSVVGAQFARWQAYGGRYYQTITSHIAHRKHLFQLIPDCITAAYSISVVLCPHLQTGGTGKRDDRHAFNAKSIVGLTPKPRHDRRTTEQRGLFRETWSWSVCVSFIQSFNATSWAQCSILYMNEEHLGSVEQTMMTKFNQIHVWCVCVCVWWMVGQEADSWTLI